MQHFLEAGHFWLFCNFQVMMWITWRRHQGYHKLTVAREFVAVTNELLSDFESWRENNKELCDDVICIPLNADLHVWLHQQRSIKVHNCCHKDLDGCKCNYCPAVIS